MSEEVRLWGGRFGAGPADAFDRLNSSLAVDRRLWPQDVAASRAHARMLGARGIIPPADAAAIDAGLAQVAEELASGEFVFREADEDIHTAVERRLTELVGDAGRRLHTARSRNDQVITDTLLHLREHATAQIAGLRAPGRGAPRTGRGPPRHPAARLHPQPARPARAPGAPPAGLRLDARPRPHAARPRHRGHGRVPARIRRPVGGGLPDRPRADGGRARLRPPQPQQPRRGGQPRRPHRLPALRGPARRAPVASRRRDRDLGGRRDRLRRRSTTPSPRVRRCSPRRRTPTRPSSPARRHPACRPTSAACSGRCPGCRSPTTRISRRTRSISSTRSTRSTCSCRRWRG